MSNLERDVRKASQKLCHWCDHIRECRKGHPCNHYKQFVKKYRKIRIKYKGED